MHEEERVGGRTAWLSFSAGLAALPDASPRTDTGNEGEMHSFPIPCLELRQEPSRRQHFFANMISQY